MKRLSMDEALDERQGEDGEFRLGPQRRNYKEVQCLLISVNFLANSYLFYNHTCVLITDA